MPTSNTVRRLALAMSDVNERLCYGTPAFYVKRKLFARLLEDGDSVVVKIRIADRERRIKADPNTFFVTDHYRKHPLMIVRLSAIDVDDLSDLLKDARECAAS